MENEKKYEIHLAPLQGYTDAVFRNAFERFFGGAEICYTPFIRMEKDGKFRNKDVRELEPERNRVKRLIPQLLPGTREELIGLVHLVQEKGYQSVDINLGCPFPLIAGKRKGAGMLPYPERVAEVLSGIQEFPQLSFSLKMRLGWEDAGECLQLLPVLNELPFSWISVHARVGKQQYKGEVDREAFGRFYAGCVHPVFYNGDLDSPEQIREVFKDFSRLKGVLIGRGLLKNPFLIREFYEKEKLSPEARQERLVGFHEELFNGYASYLQGENQLLLKMKSLWEYYLPETDRKLLKRLRKASTVNRYREAVGEIWKSLKGTE